MPYCVAVDCELKSRDERSFLSDSMVFQLKSFRHQQEWIKYGY